MLLATLLTSALTLAHPDTTTYAVLDIANESGQITALSNYIGDELSMTYGADSGYQLVERAQIHKVFKEHGFQSLGAVDAGTGAYFAVGDAYETHVRIIDVQTGKIVRMFKTSFPKSPSTTAMAANILASDPGAPQGPISTGSDSDRGPLIIDRCEAQGNGFACTGSMLPPTDGTLSFDGDHSIFFLDDGIQAYLNLSSSAAGHSTPTHLLAGYKVPVRFFINGSGKVFRDFILKYSFAGKNFVIQGAPSVK
jgi:hypothetical protein